MSAIDRITVNSGVCGGRPCIRGLRIRVKDVLDLLAAGATREDAPRLVAEAIAAGRRVYGVRVLTSTLEDTYLEAVGGETD